MTILAPLALLGLVALPVIYALYMREDAPDTFAVPTLRFWSEATSERGRRFRRQRPPLTWLMLAQMLIALILVGALARPLLNVGFLRPSGGAKQLFIVIDGSTSMGAADIAPTRFAKAKQQRDGPDRRPRQRRDGDRDGARQRGADARRVGRQRATGAQGEARRPRPPRRPRGFSGRASACSGRSSTRRNATKSSSSRMADCSAPAP